MNENQPNSDVLVQIVQEKHSGFDYAKYQKQREELFEHETRIAHITAESLQSLGLTEKEALFFNFIYAMYQQLLLLSQFACCIDNLVHTYMNSLHSGDDWKEK